MATKKQEALNKLLADFKQEFREAQREVTYEEALEFFRKVGDLVKDTKRQNAIDLAEIKEIAVKQSSKLSSKTDESVKLIQSKAEKALAEALAKQEQSLNFMRDWVRSVKDGKDADEEKMIAKLSEMIPEAFEIPAEIYEALRDDEKKIRELEKKIDKLEKEKSLGGKGGGGTSQASLKFALGKMLQAETPVGLINGSNKVYTVSNQINAVLSFGINGMVIHPSEYTTAKNTITFTTAIPAGLSGTTFEITYV